MFGSFTEPFNRKRLVHDAANRQLKNKLELPWLRTWTRPHVK